LIHKNEGEAVSKPGGRCTKKSRRDRNLRVSEEGVKEGVERDRVREQWG
jgi:hypothetical protein